MAISNENDEFYVVQRLFNQLPWKQYKIRFRRNKPFFGWIIDEVQQYIVWRLESDGLPRTRTRQQRPLHIYAHV